MRELYNEVREVMESQEGYTYRHLFIDNASKDRTVEILREIAAEDHRVQVIVNTRNFGPIRSPYHAFLTAEGDAVIPTVADLQDPPELIPQFLRKWEQGYKVVIGVKKLERRVAPHVLGAAPVLLAGGHVSSDVELIPNFTGFGLYDREVIERFREIDELSRTSAAFSASSATNEPRSSTLSRQERVESLRTASTPLRPGDARHHQPLQDPPAHRDDSGLHLSILSLLVAFLYLLAKLIFWNSMQLGTAPLLIGIYFFGAVQLFFIGILGEYIGSIHTQAHKRPRVVERERINFD